MDTSVRSAVGSCARARPSTAMSRPSPKATVTTTSPVMSTKLVKLMPAATQYCPLTGAKALRMSSSCRIGSGGGPEARMADADRGLCSLLPMRAQVLGALITQAEGFDAFFGCRQVADGGAFAALFDGRWAHWGWPWVALTEPDDDTVPATLPDTLPLPLKG